MFLFNSMRRAAFTVALLALTGLGLFGQIPEGYYSSADGKTGAELKTALYNIIKDHTALSYNALWNAFKTTDRKANGKVWDMYSDVPGGTPAYEYTFGSDQCGNYSGEGSCYNREHSFPKSWFDDAAPMYSDLFHLYPTDGHVNSRRSNYIFGEVQSATWTSTNGSKLGSSTESGSSLMVFEPIDEYKGDFARTYFYMATRYEDRIAGWASNGANPAAILDGTSYPVFKEWYVRLLLRWHEQDPVSQKEIDRNNEIYNSYQHNRNPFIDHPEYAEQIWSATPALLAFTSTPVTSAQVGVAYTYNAAASGGNGSPITISATTKPVWLTLSSTGNGTATLSGTPQSDDVGSYNVVLNATDGTDNVTQSFTVTVSVQPSGGETAKETFENIPAGSSSSYTSRSWTGDNGKTWTATGSRTDQTINGKAICMDDAGTPYVQSPSISGGCTKITFKHQQKFSGGGGVVSLYINGNLVGSVDVTTQVQTADFTTDISGDFTIKLQSNAASRIAIDDLEWTLQGEQNSPPVIENIEQSPLNVTTSDQVQVRCNVTDADGDLNSVDLLWGLSESSLDHVVAMTLTSGYYTALIPVQNNQVTVYYRIKAADVSGAITQSDMASYTVTLDTDAPIVAKELFRVYPNPFTDWVRVTTSSSRRYSFELLNGYGQSLFVGNGVGNTYEIPTRTLPKGLYLLRIDSEGSRITFKLLKM